MQLPELTIVVPGHNIARFAATLRTTVAQNNETGLHWTFVDDGSTDNTAAVFGQLANSVISGQVISLPTKGGLAAGRNAGITAATSQFITFFDADDWVSPGYFLAELEEARKFDVDIIRHGFVEVYDKRHLVRRHETSRLDTPLNPRDFIMPVSRETLIEKPQAWALVAKREFLLNGNLFNPELQTCEDRDWIWRLMLSARNVVASSLIGYYWRRNVAGSLTQTGGHEQLDFLRSYDLTIELLQSKPEWAQFLPKAYRSYLSMLVSHLRKAERLSPGDQLYLCTKARRMLKSIPLAQRRLALFGFGSKRRQILDMVFTYRPHRMVNELPKIAAKTR